MVLLRIIINSIKRKEVSRPLGRWKIEENYYLNVDFANMDNSSNILPINSIYNNNNNNNNKFKDKIKLYS